MNFYFEFKVLRVEDIFLYISTPFIRSHCYLKVNFTLRYQQFEMNFYFQFKILRVEDTFLYISTPFIRSHCYLKVNLL